MIDAHELAHDIERLADEQDADKRRDLAFTLRTKILGPAAPNAIDEIGIPFPPKPK